MDGTFVVCAVRLLNAVLDLGVVSASPDPIPKFV